MDVRRSFRALLVAPLLLLAACGGTDSSVADPPISSAPSTSVPTTRPPQRESAEHFIRRWAREDTRIQVSGDTAKFRAMSHGCRGCTQLADLVDEIYSEGGFVHTSGWSVQKVEVVSSSAEEQLVDLFVHSGATTYAVAKNGLIKHLPASDAHFQLKIRPAARSWNVSSLVQVES